MLHGHVPPAIARFHLQPIDRVPATNRLNLAIGLPLRNEDALNQLLREIYDPASTNYHRYLTSEQFTERFGPTARDYEVVKNFIRSNGLTVTATYGNRLVLDVAGPTMAVEQAFHVTLRTYRHPTEARNFFAPDTEPVVDAALPVVDIQGLSDYSRPHPKLHRMDTAAVAKAMPQNGSAPDGTGSYFGNDFRNAYVPGTALTGAGQMVGLLEFDGFYSNDIVAYAMAAENGRTNIPIQTVLIDGVSGTPGYSGIPNANAEVSLDIEMAIAIAPGLTKVVVFEGNLQNDVLNTMLAASNTVKNLSSSWGWNGGPSTTTDAIFENMDAVGQSFLNASGDSDAFTTGAGSVNGVDNTSLEDAPSSSPYITQVGGTTLTTGANAVYTSETVWNWGYDSNAGGYVGSSGGISSYYSIPSWQTNINNMAGRGGSTSFRNIPDVALTADNIYVDYDNGSSGEFGGTSCAAPLWAGFTALVNQQAFTLGKPTVGFLNPAIYTIAAGSNYAACFNDVTTGNNTSSNSPNLFYATNGYDLCTGWGTPAGQNLINALVPPDALLIVPPSGFNASGLPGGPFSPSSQNFLLTNSGTNSLIWSLINTSSWLNASVTNGTLAAGATNGVTVSLNAAANSLAVGTYSANVKFTNWNSHVVQPLQFSLQVLEPLTITPSTGFTASGAVGGPFNVTAQTLTLSNMAVASLNWHIASTSSWLNVSPASGTLGGGGQTTVAASLNSIASNLVAGIYNSTVFFTNQTSGVVQNRQFILSIGQSVVQNGGFETGDFTDWTLNGDGAPDNFVDNGSTVTAITPHSGTYFAALGEPSSLAYLSQSLPTFAGQSYLLSLWLNNPLKGSLSNPNEFSISWNGTTLYDKVNIAKTGWTNFQFVVTATSSSTVLQFGARDDNYYLGLDDVAVTPGFAPSISAQPTNLTVLSGGNAIFSATVSGSTPLAYQWHKNGTNFANGGNISGATSNVLTFTAATTNNAGSYSVVVTNVYGATTSSPAVLTVAFPPTFQTGALTVTNNNLKFVLNTVSGGVYQVLFKTSLLQSVWFTNTSITATNTTTTFVDTNPITASPQKFYRLLLLP